MINLIQYTPGYVISRIGLFKKLLLIKITTERKNLFNSSSRKQRRPIGNIDLSY